MEYFFANLDHLDRLPDTVGHRNFLLHCREYLHLVRLNLADSWLADKRRELGGGSSAYWELIREEAPLFQEIESLSRKIGEYLGKEDRFKWVDDLGIENCGLNPSLSFEKADSSLVFGDCTNLSGTIGPDLRGDLSGLTGKLNSGLCGKISPLLRGDVTGIQGKLYFLEGELNRDLIGNVTGVYGFVNPELTGDITGLVGLIDPELKGDCTGLKGTISGLTGDCTGLKGRVSGLTGDCTGLIGDCTGLSGDCTGLTGDLSLVPWDLRPNFLSNFFTKIKLT